MTHYMLSLIIGYHIASILSLKYMFLNEPNEIFILF